MILKDETIINTLLNYLIGTLWIAKETLLKERIFFWDKESDRKGHPVLSIALKKIIGNEKIPMLIGTSKKHSAGFYATKVYNNEKKTWFGSLGQFNAGDFKGSLKTRRISRNEYKPELNTYEMNLLKEWMIKRELI